MEKFAKAKEDLPTIIRRNTWRNVVPHSKDYLTRQTVINFKLLELARKAAEKKFKNKLLSSQLKDEITVFSKTVTEKDMDDLHNDIDDLYATLYVLIACFSGKYFPKQSEPS